MKYESRFKTNSVDKNVEIYTDKETGIQYLFVEKNWGCGLTVLLDRDGKPLIDKDLEIKEQ
ncbi:MAG: DUF6440 family protein [Oscillospiraceae bacterium]|nr:DUF6440 family protein [Oscillospiraceae bacterium]